jgi:hypothetical protein
MSLLRSSEAEVSFVSAPKIESAISWMHVRPFRARDEAEGYTVFLLIQLCTHTPELHIPETKKIPVTCFFFPNLCIASIMFCLLALQTSKSRSTEAHVFV